MNGIEVHRVIFNLISEWPEYAAKGISDWPRFHSFWLNHTQTRTLKTFILKHDEMKRDLAATLRDLAKFLEINPSQETFDCIIKDQELYHRESNDDWNMLPVLQISANLQKKVPGLTEIDKLVDSCIASGTCAHNAHEHATR